MYVSALSNKCIVYLQSRVYALVLTPTRELCVQVKQHLAAAAKYTQLNVSVT